MWNYLWPNVHSTLQAVNGKTEKCYLGKLAGDATLSVLENNFPKQPRFFCLNFGRKGEDCRKPPYAKSYTVLHYILLRFVAILNFFVLLLFSFNTFVFIWDVVDFGGFFFILVLSDDTTINTQDWVSNWICLVIGFVLLWCCYDARQYLFFTARMRPRYGRRCWWQHASRQSSSRRSRSTRLSLQNRSRSIVHLNNVSLGRLPTTPQSSTRLLTGGSSRVFRDPVQFWGWKSAVGRCRSR